MDGEICSKAGTSYCTNLGIDGLKSAIIVGVGEPNNQNCLHSRIPYTN